MTDTNNPAPTDDVNPIGSNDEPSSPGSDGNSPIASPDVNRKLQSERDKLRSELEADRQRLAELEAMVYGQQADKVFKDFLRENKSKFPDVKASDLRSAESEEDLETLATATQGRFDAIRNETLQKVREVPEETMTEEERSKALADLEKDQAENGQSKFQKYLKLQSTKLRK